jgi:hypothetical protein
MITSEIGLMATGNFADCAVGKDDVISLEECQLPTHLTFIIGSNTHELEVPKNSRFVRIKEVGGKFSLIDAGDLNEVTK